MKATNLWTGIVIFVLLMKLEDYEMGTAVISRGPFQD